MKSKYDRECAIRAHDSHYDAHSVLWKGLAHALTPLRASILVIIHSRTFSLSWLEGKELKKGAVLLFLSSSSPYSRSRDGMSVRLKPLNSLLRESRDSIVWCRVDRQGLPLPIRVYSVLE